MADKGRCAEIEVLNILCKAGMAGLRQSELIEQMGCAASSMSGYLKTLMAAGWAMEKGGRYTVGPRLHETYRRWQETWLAAQQTLVDLAQRGDPQPPAGPSSGEQLLGLRMMTDLLKTNRTIEQKLDELLREHEGRRGDSAEGKTA